MYSTVNYPVVRLPRNQVYRRQFTHLNILLRGPTQTTDLNVSTAKRTGTHVLSIKVYDTNLEYHDQVQKFFCHISRDISVAVIITLVYCIYPLLHNTTFLQPPQGTCDGTQMAGLMLHIPWQSLICQRRTRDAKKSVVEVTTVAQLQYLFQ